MSNRETMIRVLDTPGFSPSMLEADVTAYKANLQIFRWIVREQLDPKKNMAVQRLLYFLPNRGVPEKADATLQEELKVMYYFFGTAVFNNMVIIATQAFRYQWRVHLLKKDISRHELVKPGHVFFPNAAPIAYGTPSVAT